MFKARYSIPQRLKQTCLQRGISVLNLKIKKDPYKICNDPSINNQEFDYVVIGGGSAGISSAIKAQQLGLKTLLFDFVEPSHQGSKWGIGGTCVNVGCVPKKLFHQASIFPELEKNSEFFGFEATDPKPFSWPSLVNSVQLHIKKTNFDMAGGLNTENSQYANAMACYIDENTILYSPDSEQIKHFVSTGEILDPKKVGKVRTKYSLISVGGRPNTLSEEECPGSVNAITSDDIFL